MAWPNLSNDYLQGSTVYPTSSIGVSPQALNFTGTQSSQIPMAQFGGQVDQAYNWVNNLPQVSGAGGGLGFGFNIPTAQLGLGALNSLAGLWGGLQAQKLAKEQFNFTKNMANTNLANQTQTYNTQLADRLNARARMQGQSSADAQAEIDRNRLPAVRV